MPNTYCPISIKEHFNMDFKLYYKFLNNNLLLPIFKFKSLNPTSIVFAM